MITISKQIENANNAICQNIKLLVDQRALLSQNILSQLRNLVEGTAVLLHKGSSDVEFTYEAIQPALDFIKGKAKYSFLGKFHKLLQKISSHYTLDGDASERLMLKYYEYLFRIRGLLLNFSISSLKNLESFPIDLDPSLREYHEKIAEKIESARSTPLDNLDRDRYYIQKTRPFFIRGQIYYEVTFCRAINKVSKFDRIIAFTLIDMTDKYSAMLTLQRGSIEVLGQEMPITIVRHWEISIRPCEFDNYARLLGMKISARTNSAEYQFLMYWLTNSAENLVDLIEMPEYRYAPLREAGTKGNVTKLLLFPIFDEVRRLVKSGSPGQNVLRYLAVRMHNQTLKLAYSPEACKILSGLRLLFSCAPFDNMPLCTSLPGHNPRFWDLAESIDITGRKHELLARRVKNNIEHHGILYTPAAELEEFGEVSTLIATYNDALYYKHTERRLLLDKKNVFISGYENETVSIIEKLQKHAGLKIDGYTQAVERWLNEASVAIDDPTKVAALKQLFSNSRVALIYGAAGTGKSTIVEHIAHYFNDKQKLFLAHTNPAIDNLKRKITAQNSEFRTINSQISRRLSTQEYDLLVIDECSTVSNSDLIKVLERTTFKLLVLVGDVYQIESIQFGNWFEIIRSFIPKTSVFELTTPYRTKNISLLKFWNSVRVIGDDITEIMARNGYSTVLDNSLFEAQGQDEIILCLNYDGLYGINNINRFLQSNNPTTAVNWRVATYKINDPVLFNETERFRPVIYNNLKGRIVGIERDRGRIQFDVELDRPLSEFDVDGDDLEWMGGSTVRFSVYETTMDDDGDDDSLNTIVPFQVAYAVSIHKAQGLEYDAVKIVITDANEDDVTHSIFYTAVTRARERLQVFWTPETQHNVLKRLRRESSSKDVNILATRRSLTPIS